MADAALVHHINQALTGEINLFTILKVVPSVCEWLERFYLGTKSGPERKLMAMNAFRELVLSRTDLDASTKMHLLGLIDIAVNVAIDLVCDGAAGQYRVNVRRPNGAPACCRLC